MANLFPFLVTDTDKEMKLEAIIQGYDEMFEQTLHPYPHFAKEHLEPRSPRNVIGGARIRVRALHDLIEKKKIVVPNFYYIICIQRGIVLDKGHAFLFAAVATQYKWNEKSISFGVTDSIPLPVIIADGLFVNKKKSPLAVCKEVLPGFNENESVYDYLRKKSHFSDRTETEWLKQAVKNSFISFCKGAQAIYFPPRKNKFRRFL